MKVKILAVVVILFQIAACATAPRYLEIPGPGEALRPGQVSQGTSVKVQKLDGETLRFEVVEVTPEGINGPDGLIPYAEMESLAVMRAGSNAGWIVVGILAGAALVVGMAGAGAAAVLDAGTGG